MYLLELQFSGYMPRNRITESYCSSVSFSGASILFARYAPTHISRVGASLIEIFYNYINQFILYESMPQCSVAQSCSTL